VTGHPFMSEADFQRQVTDLADRMGWQWWHAPDSRWIHPGWPDLVLLREPVCLFREIKLNAGRLSVVQVETLNGLSNSGLDAGVWRPRDWRAIQATLTAAKKAAA
jgi:hypothetical protein